MLSYGKADQDMTGMVTTLMQKGFSYLLPDGRVETKSPTDWARTPVHVLAPIHRARAGD
jgi:hypothetical protein